MTPSVDSGARSRSRLVWILAFTRALVTVQNGDPKNLLICNATDGFLFWEKTRDYKRMGVAGFVTEFGAVLGTESGVDTLHYVTGMCVCVSIGQRESLAADSHSCVVQDKPIRTFKAGPIGSSSSSTISLPPRRPAASRST